MNILALIRLKDVFDRVDEGRGISHGFHGEVTELRDAVNLRRGG